MLGQVGSLTDFLTRLREAVPSLAVAAILLVAGWLVAWLLRALLMRLLRGWSDRVAGRVASLVRSRDAEAVARRSTASRPALRTVGSFAFWLVFLLFAAGASEVLGLDVVSVWLGGIVGYLPRVLATILILLGGLLVGNLSRSAVAAAAGRADVPYATMLGRLVQGVIVTLTVVVAFDQLGIEITFFVVVVGIATAGLVGGAALAFGLGARASVSNILGAHYASRRYRTGHRVRIGDIEGHISEITATGVVLRTADGQVLVPAKEFNERVSVLLTD